MARFDVYDAPGGLGYLLDVQADVLSALNTRVVVPLLPLDEAPLPARQLNPVFEIEGRAHVMVTQFLAAVPRGLLSAPLANLGSEDGQIMAAMDLLLVGF